MGDKLPSQGRHYSDGIHMQPSKNYENEFTLFLNDAGNGSLQVHLDPADVADLRAALDKTVPVRLDWTAGLNVYLLTRDVNEGPSYEAAAAFVVVASSPHEARKLAALGAGEEGAFPWAFEAEVKFVGTAEADQAAGVIIRDFRNGS
jgi:hypothetical protein